MTQEDKALLLKDLCARLPYGVKCQIDYDNEEDTDLGIERYHDDRVVSVCIATEEIGLYEASAYFYPDNIKPYLFPLSSMTVEQQKEANIFDDMDMDILSENLGRNHRNKTNIPTATYNYIDWLNKNHFDYRGLIEKGLAIDATRLNIY